MLTGLPSTVISWWGWPSWASPICVDGANAIVVGSSPVASACSIIITSQCFNWCSCNNWDQEGCCRLLVTADNDCLQHLLTLSSFISCIINLLGITSDINADIMIEVIRIGSQHAPPSIHSPTSLGYHIIVQIASPRTLCWLGTVSIRADLWWVWKQTRTPLISGQETLNCLHTNGPHVGLAAGTCILPNQQGHLPWW